MQLYHAMHMFDIHHNNISNIYNMINTCKAHNDTHADNWSYIRNIHNIYEWHF